MMMMFKKNNWNIVEEEVEGVEYNVCWTCAAYHDNPLAFVFIII